MGDRLERGRVIGRYSALLSLFENKKEPIKKISLSIPAGSKCPGYRIFFLQKGWSSVKTKVMLTKEMKWEMTIVPWWWRTYIGSKRTSSYNWISSFVKNWDRGQWWYCIYAVFSTLPSANRMKFPDVSFSLCMREEKIEEWRLLFFSLSLRPSYESNFIFSRLIFSLISGRYLSSSLSSIFTSEEAKSRPVSFIIPCACTYTGQKNEALT